MSVRGRVWSTYQPRRRKSAAAWGYHPAQRTWHFEVYNSKGEVVLYDNTADFQKILEAALIRVEALRHMESRRHKLKPYRG